MKRMDLDSQLTDLVGLFYEAAFAPTRWSQATDLLAQHFAANVAGIMVPPPFAGGPPLVVSTVGVPEAARGPYLAEYHRHDILIHGAYRAGGRVVTGNEVVQGQDFRRHIFWNEFSRPYTASWHGMAASIGEGPGLVFVTRPERQADFTQRDEARLALLLRQLGRALALGQRIATERLPAVALDSMALPALIVAADGGLLHANPAATALLARRGVPASRFGQALPDLANRPRLLALIAATDAGTGGQLREDPADGAGPLLLQVAPLSRQLLPVGMHVPPRQAVLVTLRDLAPPSLRAGAISEAMGLSRAEGEVAALLAEGLSGTDVARRRRVSEETVRSQISAIQVKVGVANLRELLLRLGRIAPG
jgi:DNA-binding CsgD family transcriptional regulator